MCADYNESYDVVISIEEKGENVKIELKALDTVGILKKKITNLLSIDFLKESDLYISNFHLNSAFDCFLVTNIFQIFNSSENLRVEKRPTKIIENSTNNSIKINHLSRVHIGSSESKLKNVYNGLAEQQQKHDELQKIYDDLTNTEKTLKSYYREISINLSMFSNNSVSIIKDNEEMGEYESLLNQLVKKKKKLEDANKEVKQKKDLFEKKTAMLLACKLKEKKALTIIKKNEILSNQISSLESTLDKYKEKKDKLVAREDKLFNKLKKETKQNETILKKSSEIMIYFQRIRLHYSRLVKSRVLLFMKDDQYVSVMNYKAKDPRESEMTHRKFKDLCNFSKDNVKCYQKKDNMNIPEVSLFINKQLILALNFRCYIYDFKTNSMKNFPNVKYDHEGGSMIYCGYDSCIYIIAGKSTSMMEKIKFNNLEKRNIGDWEVVSDSGTIRSYFCTFLINNKIIYLLLGYDPRSKKYLTSINRYDTALGEWSNVSIDETKSPRLSYASIIHFCDGGVFIVGGLKNYHEANGTVYLFSYSNCEWKATDFHVQDSNLVKDDNVSEESEDNNNKNNYGKKEESYSPTMRFSSNCQFIPLKFNAHDSMSSFFYAQFDNANYCHLINVRSFDHYILFQNDLVEFEEQSIIEEENDYENSLENPEKTFINKKKDLMSIIENDEANDLNENIIKSNYNISIGKKENNNTSVNQINKIKDQNNMIEEDEDDDSVVDELEVEDEDDRNVGNHANKKLSQLKNTTKSFNKFDD